MVGFMILFLRCRRPWFGRDVRFARTASLSAIAPIEESVI